MTRAKGTEQAKLQLREPSEARGVIDLDLRQIAILNRTFPYYSLPKSMSLDEAIAIHTEYVAKQINMKQVAAKFGISVSGASAAINFCVWREDLFICEVNPDHGTIHDFDFLPNGTKVRVTADSAPCVTCNHVFVNGRPVVSRDGSAKINMAHRALRLVKS